VPPSPVIPSKRSWIAGARFRRLMICVMRARDTPPMGAGVADRGYQSADGPVFDVWDDKRGIPASIRPLFFLGHSLSTSRATNENRSGYSRKCNLSFYA